MHLDDQNEKLFNSYLFDLKLYLQIEYQIHINYDLIFHLIFLLNIRTFCKQYPKMFYITS